MRLINYKHMSRRRHRDPELQREIDEIRSALQNHMLESGILPSDPGERASTDLMEAYRAMHVNSQATMDVDDPKHASACSEYVENYKSIRDELFRPLVKHSAETSNFGVLLETIAITRDPELAQKFLGVITKHSYTRPAHTVGNVDAVYDLVDYRNEEAAEVKASLKEYARDQRAREIQKKLEQGNPGVFHAARLGFIAFTGIGLRLYTYKRILGPVRKTARLPHVEEQIRQKG